MQYQPSPSAKTYFSVSIIIVLTCLSFVVTASAQIFYTVGIYDEPAQTNSVDFIAAGTTLNFTQFKSDVATAFNNDFGGVNQCYAIGVDDGPYVLSYGVSQKKLLTMTGGTNTDDIGVGADNPYVQAISGNGYWISGQPTMTFFLGNSAGITNEAVIEFGLTILSTSAFSMGNVVATVSFSDGSQAVASRTISETIGQGDTFFGFAAPNGQSIVSITFTNSAGEFMFFDDIGFITSASPSLSILQLNASRTQISWPTNVTGFVLESTTNLTVSAWVADTNSLTVIGNQSVVTENSSVGQKFYRLHAQ